MQPVSLATLRAQAQQYADMKGSDFISVSEWNGLVNDAVAELHDLLVQASPPEYSASQVQVTFVPGLRVYQLPGDFRNAMCVMRVVGEREEPLEQLRADERQYATSPKVGGTLLVEYTATPKVLVLDSDTIDCVSGWRTFIAALVAARALLQEESDATVWLGIAAKEEQRITNGGAIRDRGQPKYIGAARNVTRARHWTDYTAAAGCLRYRIRGQNIELFSL